MDFTKTANKVSAVSIIGNCVLALLKLMAGLIAHSSAMVSDAVHSASDVFSTIVVVIGIHLASRASDKDHPYGHERLECEAAVILAVVLFVTGFEIGLGALKTILSGEYSTLQAPGVLALAAAVLSIVCKEAMFWYTRYYAKKINSSALMADAWHHRSDAFSSIGALVGIGASMMGFPVMDFVASLIIFFFITKAAWDIFKDSMDKMVDHSCDEETERKIRECVLENKNVLGIDSFHTRIFGNKSYADVEIELDEHLELKQAHAIAESVHDSIEKKFPTVKHIMVHVNPKHIVQSTL